MNAATLEAARDYAFADGKNTQGVVVIRNGALVAEWYAQGKDASSWGASWSVAKSFTSALIGIAIDEGLIPGVDVSMSEYIPAWKGTERESIRLVDVLQMASGLQWNESYNPSDFESSDIIKLVLSEKNQLEYASERPVADAAGSTFNYSSGDTMLLSGVIEQATGMSAADYAREKLIGPLGIQRFDWWQDVEGHTLTYCCIDTPTREFAKFGLLFARGGRWGSDGGEQVVPAQWVADSLEPSPSYVGYGYKWWLIGRVDSGIPSDTYAALGHDGQYIYVIPSLELVVVRNGTYNKFEGEAVADPNLFGRYPSDNLIEGEGTVAPDNWSDADFLTPIVEAIEN